VTGSPPKQVLLATILLLCIGPALRAQHGAAESRWLGPYSMEPVSSGEATQWRADLAHLANELPRLHASAFHSISRASWDTAVALLDRRIVSLPRHRIIVELARLVARIGDAHTSLPVYLSASARFHVLPLRFGQFDDGLFIEAADSGLRHLVGARVLAIGGISADSSVARVVPLISCDNEWWIRSIAPQMLERAEVLHAVGLAATLDDVMLDLEVGAKRTMARVRPVPGPPPRFGLPLMPAHSANRVEALRGDTLPWHLQDRGNAWYAYASSARTMYLQIRRMGSHAGESAPGEVTRLAVEEAERRGAERVVVDIRHNLGGNGVLGLAVVRALLRSAYDDPRRLYVVIGTRTFSAASQLATLIDTWTRATFVGEPTGGAPNSYGDHVELTLPNSGLTAFVAPMLYQTSWPFDRRTAVLPVLAAAPTFGEHAAGRDVAWEAVLAHHTTPSLAAHLAGGDTVEVVLNLRQWIAQPVNRFRDAPAETNAHGYALLRSGQVADAVRVFRSNVIVHPRYANGWDSLGEALRAAGDTAASMAAYHRALELDPGNENARRILGRRP